MRCRCATAVRRMDKCPSQVPRWCDFARGILDTCFLLLLMAWQVALASSAAGGAVGIGEFGGEGKAAGGTAGRDDDCVDGNRVTRFGSADRQRHAEDRGIGLQRQRRNRRNREHQVFPVGRIVGTHGAGQHDALVEWRVTLAKDLESGLQVVKGPDEQREVDVLTDDLRPGLRLGDRMAVAEQRLRWASFGSLCAQTCERAATQMGYFHAQPHRGSAGPNGSPAVAQPIHCSSS